ITEAIDQEPERVPLSALLCVRRRVSGTRRLDLPADLSLLRDVVIECLGRRYSGARLQSLAAWAGQVSDSPSLALRFASAALGRHISDPEAPDTELFAAGLAATIGWLLRGVDVRVAHWALARALPAKHPERLVSTEAAILGEDAALLRAFKAGLIEGLVEEPDDTLDLRRPLHLLGHLDEAPLDVDFALVAREMRAELVPEVYVVIERYLRSAPKRLGLEGPERPRAFVGRAEILRRLVALFEPSNEVRTTVLYGVDGSGRSAVASALCELFAPTLEPIWVTFAGGAEAGWIPVANALGLDLRELSYGVEPERAPRWVRRIHDLLRLRPCIVVVTDVESIAEDELPGWLPSGPGECAVLVLSKSAQRPLQRERDAIAIVLRPLAISQARELLASKASGMVEAIERGDGDELLHKLDGNPRAIVTAASLLGLKSLGEVEALVVGGEASISGLVRSAVEALAPEETRLARALAACAPAGSPKELPLRIANVKEGVLARLQDKALVVTTQGKVRLHGLARIEVQRELADEEQARLEEAHAQATEDMFGQALDRHDSESEDQIYDDALFALEQMTERCRNGDGSVGELLIHLAKQLRAYPRGNHADRLGQVIEGCRVALAVETSNITPPTQASAQTLLGIALTQLPTGDRTANISCAIEAFRSALTVWTREAYPQEWSRVMNNLGVALHNTTTVDRAKNVQLAVNSYHACLTVRTRELYPSEWATTQNNLGIAFANLSTGNRDENLHRAIEAFRTASEVQTFDAHPYEWARNQNNLGRALTELSNGDRAENLRRALDAYQAALNIHTLEAFPRDWARTKSNMGETLQQLPNGDRAQNLRDAIAAYRAALTVYTKGAFPHDHAHVQHNMDEALRALEVLDLQNETS
ncbi:MAG: hypothetical protein ACMG6S_19420, partial [Byssovorax sp.]